MFASLVQRGEEEEEDEEQLPSVPRPLRRITDNKQLPPRPATWVTDYVRDDDDEGDEEDEDEEKREGEGDEHEPGDGEDDEAMRDEGEDDEDEEEDDEDEADVSALALLPAALSLVGKKRTHERTDAVNPLQHDPALWAAPTLPIVSSLLPPQPPAIPPAPRSSAASSSSSRPRSTPRLPKTGSSGASLSAMTAASDRRDMETSLSSILTPTAARLPKKRGRPVGSSALRLPPEQERKMGEANTAFILRDYPRAIALLSAICNASPMAVDPYHTLALCYEELGQLRKALDSLLVVSELVPRDAENWRRIARMARRLQDVDLTGLAVAKALREGGAAASMDAEVSWWKGWVELQKHDWHKAAATWRSVLEREQGGARETEVRRYLVQCLQHIGNDEEAMHVLEGYFNLLQARKDSDAAQQTGRQGGRAEAEDEAAKAEREEKEERRRKKAEERRARREERQFDPVASEQLSDSDSDSGYSEALPASEVGGAAVVDFNMLRALCELLVTHHQHDKVPAVISTATALLPAGVQLPIALMSLGAIALIHAGSTERAQLVLNRLLDVDFAAEPDMLRVLALVANAYRVTNHPQEALNAYRLLASHDGWRDSVEVQLRMAALLRRIGTSEEEWDESRQLYERVLEVEEGNAEARIGLAELERERRGEQARTEQTDSADDLKDERAASAAAAGEQKDREREERRAKKKAAQPQPRPRAEQEQGRTMAPLAVEEDDEDDEDDAEVDDPLLLQSEAQLQELCRKARLWHDSRDYAALIAHLLPVVQHTIRVASGHKVGLDAAAGTTDVSTSAPMPPAAAGGAPPRPSATMEDVPASSVAVSVAAADASAARRPAIGRRHRMAASRLLLSVAAFEMISQLLTALTASSAVPAATTINLVGALSSHLRFKQGYAAYDEECPTLLATAIYRKCIPLILRTHPDDPEQAYPYCQQLLQAVTTAAADGREEQEDVAVVDVIGPVLRAMKHVKKTRRWLAVTRVGKGGEHAVAVRILLGHSWYAHAGYGTALEFYHQALLLLQQRKDREQPAVQRAISDCRLYLALALLHRGLSMSSRMSAEQRKQQPVQLLRALAYSPHDQDGTVDTESAWNVGRLYQAASMDAEAVRCYDALLRRGAEARKGSSDAAEQSEEWIRRAAESAALAYKRSGNELLARRLYEQYAA